MHDFLTVGVAAPLQEAAVAGLELPDSYYAGLRELYSKSASYFLAICAKPVCPTPNPKARIM